MSENYDLQSAASDRTLAPDLPYRPPVPKSFRPKIGLIGCGGITEHHLKAAQNLNLEVVAFADPNTANANARREKFFPNATVYDNHHALLARSDIDIVDIATHPKERVSLIEDALRAGKHVLSQKPFVLDLAVGRRLADLADSLGLRLAVNQNGRWAPHFSYLRQAVKAGILGDIYTLDMALAWDHTWCKGTPFEDIHHLVLYDFAIHWYDIVANVFSGRPVLQVFANAAPAPGQEMRPPLLANSTVKFAEGLATLSFSGHTKFGSQESFTCVGSKGTLRGTGPICGIERLTLYTADGEADVALEGKWFPQGFEGSLGELICSIEEKRPPTNSARDNLASLALCFAALKSADQGLPIEPER